MKNLSHLLIIVCLFLMIGVSAEAGQKFLAKMTADQVVPPTDSGATGLTKFGMNTSFGGLYYEITVSNLSNIYSVHLHLAEFGAEGPVVAILEAPTGRKVSGIIRPQDLVGPFDSVNTIEPLLEEMRLGNVYVDIHTDNGDDQLNTAPGDYIDGEIRGQVHQ